MVGGAVVVGFVGGLVGTTVGLIGAPPPGVVVATMEQDGIMVADEGPF